MTTFTDIRLLSDKGGFGHVWLCRRGPDGQNFAKKVLQKTDSDSIADFAREVRLLRSLSHPNIVQIVTLRLQNPPYWYLMPVYATTLEAELTKVIGDEERINRVFLAILDGMAYAHSEGVIHRDLKPGNVLMNSDDDVVVSDFGLGRDLKSGSTRRTASNTRLGTQLYMAPEQERDAKYADERSDIYSLGRMLYELHTGPLVSRATDATELEAGLEMVIERCVEVDPKRRFQTVADLRHAWMTVAGLLATLSVGDECDSLMSHLSPRHPADEQIARRLLNLLCQHLDDTDFIHETVMKLPPVVVGQFIDVDKKHARRLITAFCDHCRSQGWGFSYTDSIATQCKEIYDRTGDWEVRSSIVVCLVEVGVDHNRFFVMEVAETMLEEARPPGEALVLADKLKPMRWLYKNWMRERLSVAKVQASIRDAIAEIPTE